MNRVQGTKDITRLTDDKLVLNEHERMAQIYMVQNGKKHAECDKNTFNIQKKKTQRINEIAATGNDNDDDKVSVSKTTLSRAVNKGCNP